MSDWIHCNICCVRYPSPNLQLFLTECGHIFCQRCVEKTRMEKTCAVCKKPTAVTALNKNLDPTMMAYFIPLESSIAKCVEICHYQQQHKDRLFQTLIKKYQYAKKECINLTKIRHKLSDENRALRAIIQGAGGNPYLATSTPVSSCSKNSDQMNHNSSFISSVAGSSVLRRPPPANFAARLGQNIARLI